MLLYISLLAVLCSLCAATSDENIHPWSSCATSLPRSCKEIRVHSPFLPGGDYYIVDQDGNRQLVYCEMDTICGGCGWTRVGQLDMTQPESVCPNNLRLYEDSATGVRGCGRLPSDEGSCNSVDIPSFGIEYTEVCGRVIGYQFGRPGGFHIPKNFVDDIDKTYADGISLTHGRPRQHIWTFATSRFDTWTGGKDLMCPCTTAFDSEQKTPDFVCDDYYCESACSDDSESGCATQTLYTGDQLWDGKDCGPAEVGCCSSMQPWFHKVLDCTTSDGIELRICSNAKTDREDTVVALYEIYVR